ncbi:MAG: MATE family efflux transporter [Lachnospiraceae bacterium]
MNIKTHIVKMRDNKILFGNILGTFFIKGFSLVVNLVTVTVYLNYFENQQVLGIWLAIQSILNWVLTFDMGIGNGLRNTLTKYIILNDFKMQKKCISSAYIVLGIISLIISILGTKIIQMVNWNNFLNISPEIIPAKVLICTIQMSFVGLMLYFWLKLIFSILYALQKNAIANLISLISNSLILVFAILFKGKSISSSLIVLSSVQIMTLNLPIILTTIIIFKKKLKRAKPSFRAYDKEFALKILKLGYMFFWVQITLLVLNSTNDLIITRLYGPEYVVEYNVYNRVFMLFVSFFSIITNPVWSSVSNEYNKKNILKISKIYKYLNALGIFVCGLCFIIIPIFPFIIKIIVGSANIKSNVIYALSFAIFSSVMIMTSSITCIANGINDLKPQMVGNTIAALLKIPIAIFASYYFNSWICIVWINTMLMIPSLILQLVSLKKKLI